MRRPFLLAFAVIALATAQPSPHASRATYHASLFMQYAIRNTQPAQPTDLELAQTYAPVLYFHPNERYRPQDVQVMLDHARMRQVISGVEVTVSDPVIVADLASAPADAYLDLWYGQDDTSGYLNYTAHGSYYDLNALRATYPITAYARIAHAADGQVAIQYWLFYYYNDWYNKHEGDWEMIQVELDASGQPARAVYAQHHGGTVRPWQAVGKVGDTHPKAYVALGSHATYFAGDTLYPQGAKVGSANIVVHDRTGSGDPTTPGIQLISESDPAWLAFAGRWGERAFGDFSGPTGPSQKGQQWADPFAWADHQPSDAVTWYHRNVRADLDARPEVAALSLSTPGAGDIIIENDRQSIVGHALPDPAHTYHLNLQAARPLTSTLVVEWPDVTAGTMFSRQYRLSMESGGSLTTQLCITCNFALDVDVNGDGTLDQRLPPARTITSKVDFNPPDSVLLYLPFEQLGAGLLIALLATVVPTAAYALGVWWLDRYEKEPIRLLVTTFLWGALPGALVAVAARFFVAGALAPVATESVKAAAIWFIFTRYRREFDDVLDGIVYGALVGVGFAMTTNLITYVLGFLFGGFDFLRASVLLNGIAFGLSEAYYGAVIGVGFGVSRWTADRRRQAWAPILALIVAIVLHLFTDFFRALAVGDRRGLEIIPFLATWAGILAVVAIAFLSIRKEQEIIRSHLKAEVDQHTFTPHEFLALSTPARRAQMLLRDIRRGPVALARAAKLQDLAARLAFRRRELAALGQDPDGDAVVADLRQRIAALRPERRPRDEA